MQDFHLENNIKQTYSVITTGMIHWQPVSVFTSVQYLTCLLVFVILKTPRASSGRAFFISVLYLKSMCPIH